MSTKRSSLIDTIRIGVTGHRFLAEGARLREGVREALGMIAGRFPDADMVFVTSLAQVADLLVMDEATDWRRGIRKPLRILVVLPMRQEEYDRDFTSPESVHAFRRYLALADEVVTMPPCDTHDEAYRLAGEYLAENCDVLIALWDGNDAQGVGGTGEVVARAKARDIPVYVVRTGNRKPGTDEPTVHPEQGKVEVLDGRT